MEITVNYTALLINTLLCALSVFRYTVLLYEENGPWHVFDWLRAKAGIWIEERPVSETEVYDNQIFTVYSPSVYKPIRTVAKERKGEGFFAELLNCPYCISGWISIGLSPAVFLMMFEGFWVKMIWLPFEILVLVGAIWGLAYIGLKWLKL